MPLYEYQCHGCGETFEVKQKFADEPLTKHPVCGGAVERILSAPALQFKGSGWYVTDYGKNGVVPPSSDSKTKPETKTDTKTESKPASSTPPAGKTD